VARVVWILMGGVGRSVGRRAGAACVRACRGWLLMLALFAFVSVQVAALRVCGRLHRRSLCEVAR